MLRFVLISGLVLLAACAAPTEAWRRSDGTQPVPIILMRDKADCHMYIDASREDANIGVPKHPVMEWEEAFLQCMAERGWELVRLR